MERDLATEYGSGDGGTPDDVYDRCRNIIITLHNERNNLSRYYFL